MDPEIAFIFDMDGVIVDSNPAHRIALQQFCKKYGKNLSEDELREKIYGRRNQDWLVKIFGPLEEEKMRSYADEKEALFRKVYDKDIRAVDGLEHFLKRLEAQKLSRAIATSAPRSNVDFMLEKTRLGHFFDIILDDSFVEEGKPHPDIYLKTAKALNIDPGQCIVFEDSLAGVESARNAGCKVVGITTTHTPQDLHQTDVVIEDFRGLQPEKLISMIFNGNSSKGSKPHQN